MCEPPPEPVVLEFCQLWTETAPNGPVNGYWSS